MRTSQALLIVLQEFFFFFTSNAKTWVIGCGRAWCCFKILDWHTQGTMAEMRRAHCFFILLACHLLIPKQVKDEMLWMCVIVFTDNLPSPLIREDLRVLQHPSSLLDMDLQSWEERITSANAICFNYCVLSCPIQLLVFDVPDVIKSLFSPGEILLVFFLF